MTAKAEDKTCLGWYYNFKKGVEPCQKRNECPVFKKDDYTNPIRHNNVKEFRGCVKHKP